MLKAKTKFGRWSPKGPQCVTELHIEKPEKDWATRDNKKAEIPGQLKWSVNHLLRQLADHESIKSSYINISWEISPCLSLSYASATAYLEIIFCNHITCQVIYEAEWATAKHLLELLLSSEQITCCATVGQTGWAERSIHKH